MDEIPALETPLLKRRVFLALVPLAACAGPVPQRIYEPLRYDFLTPLRLNVGAVEVGPPPPPNATDGESPVPPGPALRQLALDRLAAGGLTGVAKVAVPEAFVGRFANGLDGAMTLQVVLFGPDGAQLGSTEARVTRRINAIPRGGMPGALYDITRLMLADMNVELEFQMRRSLKEYLQAVQTTAPPEPVKSEPLPSPDARTGTSPTPAARPAPD